MNSTFLMDTPESTATNGSFPSEKDLKLGELFATTKDKRAILTQVVR